MNVDCGPRDHGLIDGGRGVRLLGQFELLTERGSVEVADGGQRLLAYLALNEGPQCRMIVASALWPEKREDRATANLRSTLWRLPAVSGAPIVVATGGTLCLAPDLRVDARHLEQVGWSIVRDPGSFDDDVETRLFHKDLLPGWYDDWVILERERLDQLRLHFLEAIVHACLAKGARAEALDVALRLVSLDPLREGSQRALVQVYCEEGSHTQAYRQVDRYRALLLDTFGCEPSESLLHMVGGRG